jgi:hypothetical protein
MAENAIGIPKYIGVGVPKDIGIGIPKDIGIGTFERFGFCFWSLTLAHPCQTVHCLKISLASSNFQLRK